MIEVIIPKKVILIMITNTAQIGTVNVLNIPEIIIFSNRMYLSDNCNSDNSRTA